MKFVTIDEARDLEDMTVVNDLIGYLRIYKIGMKGQKSEAKKESIALKASSGSADT